MGQERFTALTEFLADPATLEAFDENFSNYQPTTPEIIETLEKLNQPPDPAILDQPLA